MMIKKALLKPLLLEQVFLMCVMITLVSAVVISLMRKGSCFPLSGSAELYDVVLGVLFPCFGLLFVW